MGKFVIILCLGQFNTLLYLCVCGQGYFWYLYVRMAYLIKVISPKPISQNPVVFGCVQKLV